MAYTPLNKTQLEQAIADYFGNPDGVTYQGDAISQFILDNVYPYTQNRLDALETAFDALLTALDTMAAAFIATGITPVTGTVLGTTLTALTTAARINAPQRITLKATQQALNASSLTQPYFDGYK